MLSAILRSLWRRGGRGLRDAVAAWKAGDARAAERGFRQALASGHDVAQVYHGLGSLLWAQHRFDEGLEALRLAVEREPREAAYRLALAGALEKLFPAEALQHWREARRLAPDAPQIDSRIHKPLMELCAWDELDAEIAALKAHARSEPPERWTLRLDPFVALVLPLDPVLRNEAARWHVRRLVRDVKALGVSPRSPGRRLRVGYVAAEFRNHATVHLMAGLFERHDRERFELCAYSFGRDDGSAYRKRTRDAFERFVEIGSLNDADAAQRIAADGIDVLVDLKGYTAGARPRIFAYRPAPVQVNYLGYPGSMQAGFMDYIVADASVIPREDFEAFSEAVVWMPSSYQANDDRQPIAEAAGSRAAHGLPDRGFVFCSFNRTYKIEREIFGAWMRVLAAVPDSVLWLLGGSSATQDNLRAAASHAGVAPARLIFAPRQAKPEHLARHRLADLFLDSHTCNAHTTASDALWAGLPLLTWPGGSFAGRVAASLLHAIGLPELIVSTLVDYERMAIELSRDRERLAALRARLAANRVTMPLFRTEQYARQLEAAFQEMHARALRGARPAAFSV